MGNKYFDEYRFTEIVDAKHTNPLDTIEKFEEYIKDYPEDYVAAPYYAESLIMVKDFDKAKQVLDVCAKRVKEDRNYRKSKDKDKRDKAYSSYIYAKLKLLFFQGKYEECYKLACEKRNLLRSNNSNVSALVLFLEDKFGIVDPNKYGDDYYAFSQLLDYKEERFLEHMKKHLESEDAEEKSEAIFYKEFPFTRVFEEVKKVLPKAEPYYYGIVNDAFYMKYDFCGKLEGKQVDFFRVITYHNSDKFITMYPAEVGRNLEYIDLNYLREEEPKTKKLSQIDKFNQKYGL